jgi:hypothetical protein
VPELSTKDKILWAIAICITLLFAAGRFYVPGHPLTGWPGFYEAMAHIWIGVLVGAVIWTPGRKCAFFQISAISFLELVMFFVDAYFRN